MGGDGGVIASNRRYMRGAGTADHTADASRSDNGATDSENKKDWALQSMQNCSLTGAPLEIGSGGSIVACPYGRLYNREAAVEALLRRKQQDDSGVSDSGGGDAILGRHIRGLKDLFPVRFLFAATNNDKKAGRDAQGRTPVCPVTGTELNGTQPAHLIVKRKPTKKEKQEQQKQNELSSSSEKGPNVISERAMKEMGMGALQSEYGPFEEESMVRLAPPPHSDVFQRIQENLERRREDERVAKEMQKNKKKKRKGVSDGGAVSTLVTPSVGSTEKANMKKTRKTITNGTSKSAPVSHLKGRNSVVELAKANAASAVSSSSVLSSLFVGKDTLTEKEKKDNLFAR